MFLIILLFILVIYKNRKAVSQNIRQTPDQKQSEDDPLQSGDAHIYDAVDITDYKDTSAVTQAGPSDVLYSQVSFKKKLKKKENACEGADVTYADIELKPKKEMKKKKEKKGIISEGGDALYAQVNKKSGKVASGSDDVTYAQIKLKPI
ncbi:uncharacterized protein [Misgurnus anguillicaudatus]|uniref:uncharacterized protein n=1 Tax=Misgurnus anguillicaudatus TaxID=75329 RepID=UPI003CCF80B8